MDSTLAENPQDKDIFQTVQLCKEIQLSLRCEENKRHVQPTLSSKVAPLNLAKLQTQQQLPPLELSQTLPKNIFETRESTFSRQHYVVDNLSLFEHRPQVIMHTRSRKNSWMLCLNETANNLELPVIMETSKSKLKLFTALPMLVIIAMVRATLMITMLTWTSIFYSHNPSTSRNLNIPNRYYYLTFRSLENSSQFCTYPFNCKINVIKRLNIILKLFMFVCRALTIFDNLMVI